MFKNSISIEDAENIVSDMGLDRLKFFEGRTILISGADGFVGKHLTCFFAYLNGKFLKKGVKLVLIVNKNSKIDPQANKLIKKQGGKFLKHDLTKSLKLGFKIDYIFHLAAITSPQLISKNPVASLKVNIFGTENILNAVKDKSIKKFIYFSSSAVYGNPDPSHIPIPEDFNGNVSPTFFRSSYAEGKRAGEALTMAYYRQYGLPVNIIRPSHIYGPCMELQKDNSLNYFLNCGFGKKDISLDSAGEETRSFCYITDILSIALLASLSDASGEAFNAGNEGAEIRIIDLAETISGIFNNGIKVRAGGTSKKDFNKESMTRNVLSMKKVEEVLKFIPKVGIKTGLKRTIKSYG
jgi:UDP-glucuronate decarboxylase